MRLASKVFLAVLLLVCFGFAAWLIYHELRTPQNQGEVLNRMIELQRQHRYDKAVAVVQRWLTDPRRDVSHDGFMHGQIAFVYIAKAYKRPASRDESLHESERNLEMERELIAKAPVDLQIDLFQIGGSYEILGDLSNKDKCRYYDAARKDLQRQLPLIQAESYTAYGKTILLEPLRQEVKKHLDAVNDKSSKAGCPSILDQK